MPVIKLLIDDHRELTKIMENLAVALMDLPFDRPSINALFQRFIKHISMHYLAEEMVLYAVIRNSDSLKARMLKAHEAHHMVMQGLTQLELLTKRNIAWNAKFMVIRELVLMQIKEEENEIFPVANELLSPTEKESLAKKIREQRLNTTITLH